MKLQTTPVQNLPVSQIEALKANLEAIIPNPIRLGLQNISPTFQKIAQEIKLPAVWVQSEYANRINQLLAIPGMDDHIDGVISEALIRVSIIIDPKLDERTRNSLVEMGLENIKSNFGKKLSLTGLLHCLDLVQNGQPPFDERKYKFEIRELMREINVYLAIRAKKFQEVENRTMLGAAARTAAFAQYLKKNEEASVKVKELITKFDMNKQLEIENAKADLPKYLNIPDYLHKTGHDVESSLKKIHTYCEERSLNLENTCFEILEQVNYDGHCPILNEIFN